MPPAPRGDRTSYGPRRVPDLSGIGSRSFFSGGSQVSTDGGIQPVWHPKGGELFYRNGSRLMAVAITTGANLSVGQPRVIVDREYWVTPVAQTNPSYDVSPDGQRFLMIKESPQRPS